MTAVALQRVAVRMLFDAAFADAVYRDADAALAGLPLSADERAWLCRPDRRAWGTDPLRRWRALTGLLEEYPVSGALARRRHGGLQALDAFFSAPAFHACIQERGSLALAFGDFVVERAGDDPRLGAAARIERATARARRPAPPATGDLAPGPGVEALTVAAGAAAMYSALTARLQAHPEGPVAAVADPRALPSALPAVGPGVEHLVVERAADGGVALGEATEALAALLGAARGGAARADLLAVARRFGCEPGEDAEVLDGLVAEGLLWPVRAASPAGEGSR